MHIMEACDAFKECTDLQTFLGKSHVVYGGCFDLLISYYNKVIGLNFDNLSFRYFGAPITASKLSKVEWRSLVDKITARFKS